MSLWINVPAAASALGVVALSDKLPESMRAPVKWIGFAAAAWFAFRAFKDMEPAQTAEDQSLFERISGETAPAVVERGIVAPGVSGTPTKAPNPATNLLRISGGFLSPRGGGAVERPLFANTYPVTVFVQNWDTIPHTARVHIVAYETRMLSAPATLDKDFQSVELPPNGGTAICTLNMPTAYGFRAGPIDITTTLRLYAADHLVAKITFEVP